MQRLLIPMAALALVAGCSGSCPSDSAVCSSSAYTIGQGVFVDAPVEGLTYESSGITGTTDSSGKFSYRVGSTVKFFVGGVALPAVEGASLITPLDLVGASSPESPEAVYIARFLQSVDSDGNPDNGIRIDKTKLASSVTSPSSWTTDPLANLVTPAALAAAPSEAVARAHMKSQLATLTGLPRMSLVGRYTTGGTTANTSDTSSSRTTRLYD